MEDTYSTDGSDSYVTDSQPVLAGPECAEHTPTSIATRGGLAERVD
ncbi:MAG TPA: hypothetical protein VFZ49_09925 [Pyrinomonadaceae bacterium]